MSFPLHPHILESKRYFQTKKTNSFLPPACLTSRGYLASWELLKFLYRDVCDRWEAPQLREKESSALLCWKPGYIPAMPRGQTGPVVQGMSVLRDPRGRGGALGESVTCSHSSWWCFLVSDRALGNFVVGLVWSGNHRALLQQSCCQKDEDFLKHQPAVQGTQRVFASCWTPGMHLCCAHQLCSQKVKQTSFGQGGRTVQRGSRIFI